jgi:hypothetical protein
LSQAPFPASLFDRSIALLLQTSGEVRQVAVHAEIECAIGERMRVSRVLHVLIRLT